MDVRFTEMNDGFQLLPVLIGLFAVNQILADIVRIEDKGEPVSIGEKSLWLGPKQWLAHGVNLLKILGHWYMDWDAAGHRSQHRVRDRLHSRQRIFSTAR